MANNRRISRNTYKNGKNNNPNNEESALYAALTRLFSGPMASYKQQAQIRYKRRDLDRFKFTSASGQSFKKKTYNPFEAIQTNVMANQSRAERYSDFDQMEFMPELASALDIYADEMTTSNQFKPLLVIDCKNEEIKSVLQNLYYKVLNIEQNLYGWCRTMCKFGDFFLYLDIDEKLGVKNVLGLPSPEVERLEGTDETNPAYVQFQWNSAAMTFESWQIAHFRVLGQDKYAPYGSSILEPVRRIWRQLTLLEDAMMAYRIVRAPDRRVFYIDVGNVPPQDVEQYMQKVITQMKRNQIVDPTTGRVDLRYNPMSIDEDYFIPIRGAQNNTKIDTLPGGAFTGVIDDVKYLRDKMFSGIKIPQAYLARGDGAAEDKSMLAQKDIRFARVIQRLQRVVIEELVKIGMIHLFTLGFRNEDLLKFSLKLHNPSVLSELQVLEHLDKQLAAAGSAKEQGFSKRFIFENILKISADDFLRIQRDLVYDAEFSKSLEAIGTLPEEGMGGSGGMGDLGDDMGDEAPIPDAPEEEVPATGDSSKETPLLAAPAQRKDGSVVAYATQGSKGKTYKPVASDGRPKGASKRHTASQAGFGLSASSKRSLLPGAQAHTRLGHGIAENLESQLIESMNEKKSLYETDEKLLVEVQEKLDAMKNKFKSTDKTSGDNENET